MYKNTIGLRLKNEMKRRSITSAELAKRADVKTSFIYDVISGKSANPSPVRLARLAQALGISLSALVSSGPELQQEAPPGECVAIPRIRIELIKTPKGLLVHEERAEPHFFRSEWVHSRLHASPADLRMIYLGGDGMEPALCHNDLAMLDTNRDHFGPPGIFVLYDGKGIVTRRI